MARRVKIDIFNMVKTSAKKDLSIEDMREKVVEALEKRGPVIIGGVAYITLTYGTRLIKQADDSTKIPLGQMTEAEAKEVMPSVLKQVREQLDTGGYDDQIRKISNEAKNRPKTTKKKAARKKK